MNIGNTRAERVATAQRVLAWVEVDARIAPTQRRKEAARLLGVKVKTLHGWIEDPDGSKQQARRESYRGTCENCGAATDGSAGPGKAPTRCRKCQNPDERVAYRTTRFCGVPGCRNEKAKKRHVCAAHAPTYDRLRLIVRASEPTMPWGDASPHPADDLPVAA